MILKKPHILRDWCIVASLVTASLALPAAALLHQKDWIFSTAPNNPRLNQLQQSLLRQLNKNGIKRPQSIALNGKTPGFFGWMERASMATDNLMQSPIGMHDATEGETGSDTILGISSDGEVRNDLRNRLLPNHHSNYLDVHFDAFQRAVGVHETVHYVDARLGLSAKIYTDTLKTTRISDTDPKITLNKTVPGTSILETNIRERIADAGAVLYILSNENGSDIANAMMAWRDTHIEATHYTASTIKATIDAFTKAPRANMDVVAATRAAASIVKEQMPSIIREQRAIVTVSNAQLGINSDGLGATSPAEEREIISRKQAGLRALSGISWPRASP